MKRVACMMMPPEAIAGAEAFSSRPLHYRAASYHAADEEGTLSDVAALGFNVIELQVEGDTMRGLEDLRRRENKLGFIKEAKALGLEIAIWTHEFSGLDPNVIGPISVSNSRVWEFLRNRYRVVCRDLLPEADYWVLTVVETEQNATEPDLLRKLVETINDEVSAAGKTLMFRSFVWHPAEMKNVVKAMQTMPAQRNMISVPFGVRLYCTITMPEPPLPAAVV